MPFLRVLLVVACLTALPIAIAEGAARAGAWTGKATSPDGKFAYGKVTFTVKGKTMRNLKIESVTVSGCGGFKSIVVPKLTIKGNTFSGSYAPVPDVEDIIVVKGTISGRTAKGRFTEGPLCAGDGKFTARAK
jgi:hypothetical protein